MIDLGSIRLRCAKPGGDTLVKHGGLVFLENQEIDLCSSEFPELYCGSYDGAKILCEDPAYEIAQKVASGDWVVIEDRPPAFLPVEWE